jgi:hypothetical protein
LRNDNLVSNNGNMLNQNVVYTVTPTSVTGSCAGLPFTAVPCIDRAVCNFLYTTSNECICRRYQAHTPKYTATIIQVLRHSCSRPLPPDLVPPAVLVK